MTWKTAGITLLLATIFSAIGERLNVHDKRLEVIEQKLQINQ